MTPEEWEQVQDIIDRRPTIMKGNACPFYNLFHGLVYCATCGKSMQVRYEKVGRTGKNRFTGEMREPIDRAYYICQTYNRLGKNACTSHKIEARDLYNLVLKDIQELDESVLNRLISKILIGEVKKVDGQKVQEVRIVYNFVGEIPEIAA